MFDSKKKRGLSGTAATGLLFDPELRRALLEAGPPVAKLGLVLGKRHLARQLGRAAPQTPPRRRVLPAVGAVAVVAVGVALATDPARRRRLQRLFVH